MKYSLYISTLAMGALVASCADEFDQTYNVPTPQSIKDNAYLLEYAPLKEYVTNPNFKLGAALDASSFINGDMVYEVAASNFHEVVAGNAMKMASCVDGNGSMDFGKVSSFVSAAEGAGLSVFGHTLAWHSQASKKWLEKLIADKEPQGGVDNTYIQYDCGAEAGANSWDKQAIYSLPAGKNMVKGKTYVITVKIKADNGGTVALWPIWDASENKNQWGGSNDVQYLEGKTVTSDFAEYTWEFEAAFDHDKLQFVFGQMAGLIGFDDVSCKEKGTENELIENGDFSQNSKAGWSNNWNGPSFDLKTVSGGASTVNPVLTYECGEAGANSWDKQAIYSLPAGKNMVKGKTYVVTVKLKSTDGGTVALWPIWDASENKNQWGGSNDVQYLAGYEVNSTFKEYTWEFEAAFDHDKLQFVFGQMSGNLSFDDLSCVEKDGTADLIENGDFSNGKAGWSNNWNGPSFGIEEIVEAASLALTPEEKKEILTGAMNKWVNGMMAATEGKVKAWDVVNEALSGADFDGDGKYDLQHASNVDPKDAEANFYWQDYLGDVDYVRIAVSAARRGFVAAGGNAADLKLFINDYNLESTWDDNQKLKSLVEWIKVWENDTIKIDGIGSQMHISCNANADAQKKQEECVVNMLNIMVKSGKLVRISELDMGYIDENGKSVPTGKMSEAQHKQMAEFYKFIVKKYLEIVPAAQQYGICQWCLTDSPAESGWRGGEPTGLWDANYNRKATYAGFADGLQKK